ncbi:MAG TPA: DUF512 domain-containing protein [Acidimicrobiales bacterium]|nr:DUF512 domain-containing protein [Acidimicrobiales bacterium]
MSAPRVLAVAGDSPAARAGLIAGDEVAVVNGAVPRDVLEWQQLTEPETVELDVMRGGLEITVSVHKQHGEPLGAEIHSSVFDRVRTCDNHCAFCFIYQLPAGMRKSLSLKDDDYRLSFLYGNFTTLTRFTEADLERVVAERLSPLNVSIHATDPVVRSRMLRNDRGGTSLRWLSAMLDAGIEVHGQVVVCPGINDGDVLDDTLAGVLDQYSELASLCVVPLGVSDHSNEPEMRHHQPSDACAVIDAVEDWQGVYEAVLGRRLVFAADEYYLLAGRAFPQAEAYEGFPMHEDGIGMARTFEIEFEGGSDEATRPKSGFFAAVDGAPAEGYRAERTGATPVMLRARSNAPIGILTAPYGAAVLGPILERLERDDVRIVEVQNRFFGGNIAVTGLMVGTDLIRVLNEQPRGHRYLLPDVCLTEGRFLDDLTPADLPQPVEVVSTDGAALRRAIGSCR